MNDDVDKLSELGALLDDVPAEDVKSMLQELAEELESGDEEEGEPASLVDRAVEESGLYNTNEFQASVDADGAVKVSYNGKADATSNEMDRLRESDWYLQAVNGESLLIRPEDDDD